MNFSPRIIDHIVTEDSVALEFAEIHKGELLFDHDRGKWFRYDGSRWSLEGTKLALEWARQLARRMAETDDPKARYAIRKTSFASGVERFAQSDRAFAVTSDVWDRDTFLLGTPKG